MNIEAPRFNDIAEMFPKVKEKYPTERFLLSKAGNFYSRFEMMFSPALTGMNIQMNFMHSMELIDNTIYNGWNFTDWLVWDEFWYKASTMRVYRCERHDLFGEYSV